MVKSFCNDNRGFADKRIILLAAVIVIFVFSFLRLKETIRCEHGKSIKRLSFVLFSDKTEDTVEGCSANGIPSDKDGEGNPSDKDGDSKGGGSGADGGMGGGSGYIPPEGDDFSDTPDDEGFAIDYYDETGIQLTCVDTTAQYRYRIPSNAPPQSMGTQSLTIHNKKGWDMWIMPTKIETKNHLKNEDFYKLFFFLESGKSLTLSLGWKWDAPFGYTGDRGEATVYFKIVCTEPKDDELYRPYPDPIGRFSTSSKTDTSISLRWNSVPYADSYKLTREDDVTGIITVIYEGKNLNYKDTNLVPDRPYYYTLTAINKRGESDKGLYVYTKKSPLRPDMPENFISTAQTETTISMKWDAVPNATSYTIRVRDEIVWTGTNVNYTAINLVPGQHYNMWVQANNEYGSSDFALYGVYTKGKSPYPGIPTNFRVKGVTNTSITLEWDKVDNAERYEVILNDSVTKYTKGNTMTFTGLEPDTFYYFYLYGENKWGFSDRHAYATGRTSGINPNPPTPENLDITNITNNSMTLSWNPVDNATHYRVELWDDVIYTGKNTVLNVDKLAQGRYYEFYVQAISDTGKSGWASIGDWTTNHRYDASDQLTNGCTPNEVKRTFQMPENILPGKFGRFEINLTNTMNTSLTARIINVEKIGSYFTSNVPIDIQYSSFTQDINPKDSIKIPIVWSYPMEGDRTSKSGHIVVSLLTDCK